MFWRCKTTNSELINLRLENDKLRARVKTLEYNVETISKTKDASACTHSIDFGAIHCWSIERQSNGYTGKTILGYNLYSDTETMDPREWTLYCNEEQHERLVAEFNEIKKERNAII